LAGNSIQFGGRVIHEFLGIPFAEAPVGDLRYLNTKPLTSTWTGIRDASKYGPACMQPPKKGKTYSEDCLHLNVWAPQRVGTNSAKKHVMLYLHGGSFNMGSASESESNGTVLASKYDVVVVTANYRLGFFGYLFTGDGVNTNMAHRDQQMALQWVKENIASFGGDPEHVTVFGHSAGAISAGILALSPLTNSLIDGAIQQSGVPYSFLRPDSQQVALTKSKRLSQFLNCTRSPDQEISTPTALHCLQSAPAEQVLALAPKEKTHSLILPNPVFGDSFLPSSVPRLLDHKLQPSGLKPIDMVIGFQKDDAEVFLMSLAKGFFGKQNRDREISHDQIPDMIHKLFNHKLSPDDQQQVIKHFFSNGGRMTSNQLKDTMIRVYGDLYIYCPSYFMAQKLIESSDDQVQVFMYELRSKASKGKNKHCEHVCHGEEIQLVFGAPFLHPETYDEADRRLSDRVMNHWTQFARNGYVKVVSFNSLSHPEPHVSEMIVYID
jgi:carboxylesterase type B